jgi:transcriptional regulator with XRE-family HTH domain
MSLAESVYWTPPDTLAARLYQLRKGLKLTQAEAADRCQIARATWSTWENGALPANMAKAVEAICRGLSTPQAKIDPNWLMWGTAVNVPKTRTRRSGGRTKPRQRVMNTAGLTALPTPG